MVKISKNTINFSVSLFLSLIMLFFLVQSLNKERQRTQYLKELSIKNDKIEEKYNEENKLLRLYKTQQYKDLYAKENLNLLNPWEKIIIIKYDKKSDSFLDKYRNVEKEDVRNLKNSEQWKKYFNMN